MGDKPRVQSTMSGREPNSIEDGERFGEARLLATEVRVWRWLDAHSAGGGVRGGWPCPKFLVNLPSFFGGVVWSQDERQRRMGVEESERFGRINREEAEEPRNGLPLRQGDRIKEERDNAINAEAHPLKPEATMGWEPSLVSWDLGTWKMWTGMRWDVPAGPSFDLLGLRRAGKAGPAHPKLLMHWRTEAAVRRLRRSLPMRCRAAQMSGGLVEASIPWQAGQLDPVIVGGTCPVLECPPSHRCVAKFRAGTACCRGASSDLWGLGIQK